MRNALAHFVVYRDEGPFGFHRNRHGFRQQLDVCEESCDQSGIEIRECLEVLSGHEEDVAGEERPSVQDSDRDVVFEHDVGGSGLVDDIAEDTLGRHGHVRFRARTRSGVSKGINKVEDR